MKTVNRISLVNALDQTKYSIASKDTVPAWTHVYANGGKLFAFNGESGIEVKVEHGPSFDVKAELFAAILRALEVEDVKLEVSNSRLELVGGGHKSKLPMLNEPVPYPNERPEEWHDVPAGFVEALKRCLTATSKDDSRPHLCAVFVLDDYFYGTDGHIAIRCHVEGMPEHKSLISSDAVNTIVNLGQPKRIAWTSTSMWLDYYDTTFFTLLMEHQDTWPAEALDQMIEATVKRSQYKIPDEFISAIKRALVFPDHGRTPSITLSAPEKNAIRMSSKINEFDESIDAEIVIERAICVNPALLLKGLEYTAEIGFGDTGQDPILAYGEIVECTVLIMPMRGEE